MAGGREIKTKIKSVQNTRKVTRALEMVSASKIRKAQERMKASRPYARAMRQVIGHLAQANSEFQHPYLVERKEIRRVGYVIVSSDRGLAGGLNTNLFRKLLALEEGLHAHFANTQGALIEKINASGDWNDEIEAAFKQGIEEFKKTGSW